MAADDLESRSRCDVSQRTADANGLFDVLELTALARRVFVFVFGDVGYVMGHDVPCNRANPEFIVSHGQSFPLPQEQCGTRPPGSPEGPADWSFQPFFFPFTLYVATRRQVTSSESTTRSHRSGRVNRRRSSRSTSALVAVVVAVGLVSEPSGAR